ncbi:hypothetical protein [Luteimicrobium subarcticum]|uniref:hypothetical protein n=1 Tax=Luteimicrobium subarcticum TaxID=620910 RepID=UPI000C23A472|nr:hypothetical protein [Luteimicrobium subarcticum]
MGPSPEGPLGDALLAGDRAAALSALRDGPVVVPHLTRDDGTPQVLVFPAATPLREARADATGTDAPADEEASLFDLCVFSSAATLEAFLGDDPGREFSLRRRDSLAPFLRRHGAALSQVVVDPGSPGAMAFTVADVLAALETAPAEDDPTGLFDATGAGISPEGREALASVDEPGGSRGVGLELNLPDHWALLDLEDAASRDDEIRAVVKRQTAHLGDRGASLRRDLRAHLTDAAERAAGAGGQVMAYLALPGENAAVALQVTLYWHDLGPVTTVSHLRRIQERLAATDPGDDLTRTETLSGPFVRHVRRRAGAAEVGGAGTTLLLVDYWAEAPGGQAVARLAFSTPHVEMRDRMLGLTDKVLFATEWILASPEVLADVTA